MKVVVVGYDGDAVEAVKHTVDRLKPYFEVLVADIADAKKIGMRWKSIKYMRPLPTVS